MSNFRVGDRVVIRRDSRYYGRDRHFNPTDATQGTVTEGRPLQVRWDGGRMNIYRSSDLRLALCADSFVGKYRIPNEEVSALFQQLLFKYGVKWYSGGATVLCIYAPYLYVRDGYLTFGEREDQFRRTYIPERTVEEVIELCAGS